MESVLSWGSLSGTIERYCVSSLLTGGHCYC